MRLVEQLHRHAGRATLALRACWRRSPNRDSQSVITALIDQAHHLPDELIKSLTWDRGKEMAQHKRFTMATDVEVYFCDPQSPWQRGSNENTNGLAAAVLPQGHQPQRPLAGALGRRWRGSLMEGHARRSASKHRLSVSKRVLRRPTKRSGKRP